MIQRVDVLSKVCTEWVLRKSYITITTTVHFQAVFMSNLAQTDKVIKPLITRRDQVNALVLV